MSMINAINWGTQLPNTNVSYGFIPGGFSVSSPVGTVQTYTWVSYEMQQVQAALETFENITNLNFTETGYGSATFQFANYYDGDSTLGAMGPPGTAYAGVGVFAWDGVGWDFDQPGTGGLEQGGYGFVTLIHEIGHGLGLAHPHDNGGGSPVYEGVSGSFGSYGDFDFNQGIYTIMSYNDGWQTGPAGTGYATTYGNVGTPMAFDIAVLQAKYGANMSYRTGNDVYVLPDENTLGTFWSCIWDAGGADEIRYDGFKNAVIDLRAATLQ